MTPEQLAEIRRKDAAGEFSLTPAADRHDLLLEVDRLLAQQHAALVTLRNDLDMSDSVVLMVVKRELLGLGPDDDLDEDAVLRAALASGEQVGL